MRRAAGAAIFVACASAFAQSPAPPASPQRLSDGTLNPRRSPRNASYTIDARLNPATRSIAGTETIVWRNVTTRPASDLQFHLYWNAWKNTRSTFFRELALEGSVSLDPIHASSMEVGSVRLVDGAGAPADLTAARRFIAPDDGNGDDETVMAVALPMAVQPGASVSVEVQWTARVPGPIARTDVIGNTYFIAQWFPKLGVLEDDGWNCHQFHADTEFFADYGVYDVRLTVPDGWVVGATGIERSRTANGDGTATHRYYQEDVHDFAWTASPDWIERREVFEHASLPSVDMRLLLQPGHEDQADRHFAAARTALRWFGEWFGAYPYGHLTIVDPAYQSSSGGMEYPTLITAGTTWLNARDVTVYTPEEVVIHEAGHQWWYGIVGTNEFEHAWMDEGLTTYAAARALAEDFPRTYLEERYFGGFVPWTYRDLPVSRDTYWNRLSGYRRNAESDRPSTDSFRYAPGSGPSITYNKTALWLHALERTIGWPALQRALSVYFERHAFRHPAPDDFFRIVNEVSGRDLSWFFNEVHQSANVVDYGIEQLQSDGENDRYRTTVVVRRYGEAVLPVDVAVTFADGETVREQWDGRDRWKRYTYDRAARALSAQVDPYRVLLLDVDYTNNSRTLRSRGGEAATKWTLKWMVWLQDALATWGFWI